ncbi:GNAT family N-acetyltransferase [Massilia cellulosiltytica]|uniref:GNAT family N-acetyltransferase n=1 Tax=Massilia cellulosiltytica TaxID=2683234 RepID=UPI0039B42A31
MMAIRSLGTSPLALPAPWGTRPRAARCPDRFELNVATAYHDRPDILAAWHRMLAAAAGPETLYQSPQFFNHLIDMDRGRDANHELFIVRRSVDYAIVGFVPVRTLPCRIAFHAGPVPLFGRTLRACQVLGSVPLLDPAEPGLAEFIAQQLLDRFAHCHVLYLQAVPQDGWTGIAGVAAYVLNGWRACHTQPLPDSVDAYLKHFSAKKRYNLSRQVRLLTEAAGPLHVLRIVRPGQVGAMLDAMIATDASRAAGRAGEQARLESLARHGLLLSYVIRCGENDVAVVYGMRSASVWHVYKILCRQDYLHLSAGTSAIHLAVQDVLAHFTFDHIDFGYGTPHAEFRSTHVLQIRGLVLLHRARSGTAWLLSVHGRYDALNGALIRQVKRFRK